MAELAENGRRLRQRLHREPAVHAGPCVALMTGLLPSRTGSYDNAAGFSSEIPTFAHHLRSAGYRTVLAGKMHFCGPDQLHGFEERLTTDIYPADYDWTPDWGSDAAAALVPRHVVGHRRRPLRPHQPARLRRRGRLRRRAWRCSSTSGPATSGRSASSSRSPIRTTRTRSPRSTGTATDADDIPMPAYGYDASITHPHDERLRAGLRDGRRRDHRRHGARRAPRLPRRGLVRRRPPGPAARDPARDRPTREHRRDPDQRPRRHAGRARALVQDVLLRGLRPGAARGIRSRALRRRRGWPRRCRRWTCCRRWSAIAGGDDEAAGRSTSTPRA